MADAQVVFTKAMWREASWKSKKKRFRTMFPNLSQEMKYEHQHVGISSIRSDAPNGEKASSKTFDGYMPDIIDFIRRCDNEQQAIEII